MKIRGLLLFGALAACSSSGTTARRLVLRNSTHVRTSSAQQDRSRCDATRPGRTSSEYDTNSDGVPDVRKVFQTVGEGAEVHSVLVCREADLNHDGVKDVYRFYNDEGRTLREEEDRDFDGRIDVITYFEAGDVVRREFDTNGDGMVDMRLYFRDHRVYRAERELQADSSPDFHADYWEFYDTHGNVVRIGWDYDHDGRADRWDRVDRLAPQRPQQAATPAAAPAGGAVAPGTTPATPGAATPAAAPGATPSPTPPPTTASAAPVPAPTAASATTANAP